MEQYLPDKTFKKLEFKTPIKHLSRYSLSIVAKLPFHIPFEILCTGNTQRCTGKNCTKSRTAWVCNKFATTRTALRRRTCRNL